MHFDNLTLIIPAKNEIESINTVLQELRDFNQKLSILVVVDNKEDNTLDSDFFLQNYKDLNYAISTYPGYSGAVRYGVEIARTNYCCIYNADGSFDPKTLKNMLSLTDKYDFIYASRYKKDGSSDDDTIITFIGNKIFTLLGKIFFNVKISDILYSYVLFKRDNFIKLKLSSNSFNLALELPLYNSLKKSNYTDIPSHERKRYSGKKKVREFVDGFNLLIFMISTFLNKKNIR